LFTDKKENKVARIYRQEPAKASLKNNSTAQFKDDRTQTSRIIQLQLLANNSHRQMSLPVQKKNDTGLPDQLKSGIESLSGYSMDDVKVHYNSAKPAQLQAHAYAQGTHIHLASGREKHLPHEAWHVVQQKQGRVKPNMQLKGNWNVNNDPGLEREADLMGGKANQLKLDPVKGEIARQNSLSQPVIQRAIGAEIELPDCTLEVPEGTKQGTLLARIPLSKTTEIHAENPRLKGGVGPKKIATLEYATGIYEQGQQQPSEFVQDIARLEGQTRTIDVVPTYKGYPVDNIPKPIIGTFQINVSPKRGTGFNLQSIFEKEERVDYDEGQGTVTPAGMSILHANHVRIREGLVQSLLKSFHRSNVVSGPQQKLLATFFVDAATVVSSVYVSSYYSAARRALLEKRAYLAQEKSGLTGFAIKAIKNALVSIDTTAKNAFLVFPRFDIQRAVDVLVAQTGDHNASHTAMHAFYLAIQGIGVPNYPDYAYSKSTVSVPLPDDIKAKMELAAHKLIIERKPLIPDRTKGEGPETEGTILEGTSSSLIPKNQASEGVYEVRNPFNSPIKLGHWAKAMEQYEHYLAGKGVRY
tara:strand:- start:1573 stop:3321 length:1749 start_codon:yes stop_codon:yes gene_type:complete